MNEHIENAVRHLPSGGLDAAGMSDVVGRVIDAIPERHKLAQLIYIESSNPASPAFEITERSFEQAAVALQRWFATTVGEKPSRAYLKSVMAGTRWLVHDAIIAGLTPRSSAEAKRASQQLFEGMYLTVKKAARDRKRPLE